MLFSIYISFLPLLYNCATGCSPITNIQDSVKKVEITVTVKEKKISGFESTIKRIAKKRQHTSSLKKPVSGSHNKQPKQSLQGSKDLLPQTLVSPQKQVDTAIVAPTDLKSREHDKHIYYAIAAFLIIIGVILGYIFRTNYFILTLAILLVVVAYYLIMSSLLFLN